MAQSAALMQAKGGRVAFAGAKGLVAGADVINDFPSFGKLVEPAPLLQKGQASGFPKRLLTKRACRTAKGTLKLRIFKVMLA